MTRLEAHKKELYELRFSPMCKPAGEVANLTQLESHTTRSRVMMMWRIAEGHLDWGSREAELIYESTLDSISEAFDVFHYPISRYMLDARADLWQAGVAPQAVKQAVEAIGEKQAVIYSQQSTISEVPVGDTLVLAGEIALLDDRIKHLDVLQGALDAANVDTAIWAVPTGATAYALGAWDVARSLGEVVIQGIQASGARTVIADGPLTAWALTKIYPDLDLLLPEDISVVLLSEALDGALETDRQELGKVFFHDGRAAYQIADSPPNHMAVQPGYVGDEAAYGEGIVYEAPRRLLETVGADLVNGAWIRGLSKSCGADDGLWLTHPELAKGLAAQRLEYAQELGAKMLVTDSALCANYLKKAIQEDNITVSWLPEII